MKDNYLSVFVFLLNRYEKMQYQHFLRSIFPLPTRIWEQECLEMAEGLLGGQVNTDYV